MKRIVGALVTLMALLGASIASPAVEAGGGGGAYACQNDKKVSDTYDGAALEVTVRDSCFGPVIARVAPGTELRWVNRGQQPHNIVDVSKVSQPLDLQAGRTVTMTFAQAGAFVYYCAYHPGMTGAVFVGDSLEAANPEPANVSAAPRSLPPQNAPAPSVASIQPTDGNSASGLGVVLLALAVGIIAGGGSTLLTRRLDRH